MMLIIPFLLLFLAIAAWSGATHWYLKRYVVEDDLVHHRMVRAFQVMNVVFAVAIALQAVAVPWSEVTLADFIALDALPGALPIIRLFTGA